jgi:anti-sigma factor RsiW
MTCHVHATGTIDLFFYGELSPVERAAVTAHLRQCPECRAALEDLTIIRSALASRPDVATPPGGDWSRFMSRLERAVQPADHRADTAPPSSHGAIGPARRSLVPYLAMAALLALVTIGVLAVRGGGSRAPQVPAGTQSSPRSTAGRAPVSADPALASLSDQHFERSKLVVLGLATRDTTAPDASTWRYERELASSLLNDTRLYRLAAEERGMKTLAGVMRDLELVLLQTSMAEHEDSESLEQLQRLIRRRDLITKMNVSYTEP